MKLGKKNAMETGTFMAYACLNCPLCQGHFELV